MRGIDFLESRALEGFSREISLSVPRALLAGLGNPQDQVPTVHVAGTNGKGSTSAFIAATLIAAGYRVGQFTSPHLASVTERCVVNGVPVALEQLDSALCKVADTSEALKLNPSYFESVCAATLLVFAELELDWAVVEVGLGGRLDATNVASRPRVSVITSIDFDHMRFLGNTLSSIAREKAGIAREGVPLICGDLQEEAREAVVAHAESVGAGPVSFLGTQFSWEGESLVRDGEQCAVKPKPLGLRGRFQASNAAIAARVALELGLSEEVIQEGLARACWPGRFEEIRQDSGTSVIVDCAHNVGGVRALMQSLEDFLRERSEFTELSLLISVLDRKDWKGMLDEVRQAEERFKVSRCKLSAYFTSSGHHAAVPAEELQRYFGSGRVYSCVSSALIAALSRANETTLVVVFGTISCMAEARARLGASEFRTFR